MRSWDDQILLFAAAHRSDALDAFFRGVTWLGSLYLLAPIATLVTILLLRAQRRWEAALLIIGFGAGSLGVHIVKALLGRSRPDLVEPLIALPKDGSFPSAHTAQIVAFTLCVVLIVRRTVPEWQVVAVVVALVFAICVGISRVYLQVHFPSDVLAGALGGILWVALVQRLL
jgi:undecaprenyl-diphosphatase